MSPTSLTNLTYLTTPQTSMPNLYTTYPDTNITFGIKNSGYPSLKFVDDAVKVAIPILVKIQPEGAAQEAAVFSVVGHLDIPISLSLTF